MLNSGSWGMNGSDVCKPDGLFLERGGHVFPGPFPLPTGWNISASVAVVRVAIQTKNGGYLLQTAQQHT